MTIKDWNHFIRPNLWVYGLTIYLIGILSSGVIFKGEYIIGGLVAILLCTSSITLNHYFDYKTDKKSKQLYRFPVASGKISRLTAGIFSLVIIFISILLTYLFLDRFSLYLTLFANFMVITYSAPPVRIKERAFLETLWNGIGYGWIPYYLALLISNQTLNYFHYLLGLVPLLISASGHILLQVRDIEDDKKGGVRTTSTKLGLKKMKRISGVLVFLAGVIIIFLAGYGFLNYLAWLSLSFGGFVLFEHKRMKKDVEKSYRKLQVLYVIGGILFVLSILKI